MSWINQIDNVKFSIQTGDGKIFYPLFKPQEKSKDYNTTVFNFINVPKSLVERKKPQSNKFSFTFWFEGENCIEQSQEFENSADDSRFWTVTHPYYGTIKGQPMSLSRNDANFNITEITVEFWESIDVDYPKSNYSVKDNTFEKKNEVLGSAATSYASNNSLENSDIQKNNESNVLVQSSFEELQTNETKADYQNAYADAQKANLELLDKPLEAIQKALNLIDLPSTYNNPISDRLKAYERCYERLKRILNTKSDKAHFESTAGVVIASMANASVNPLETDYQIVSELQLVSIRILFVYQDYLQIIDDASVDIYDIDNAWQPDATVQTQLHELVVNTIANLYELSFEAQQERIVYTEKDTNLILLTHRYLGLDASDENIERFREINGIKNNELFRIKKDRQIKYYV